MSLLVLISSYRVRAVCTWVSHRTELVMVPAAVVGALVIGGLPVVGLWLTAAGVATGLLVAVAATGELLHAELDRAGVPCASCEIAGEVDDDARS
jgi:hypothetical protein